MEQARGEKQTFAESLPRAFLHAGHFQLHLLQIIAFFWILGTAWFITLLGTYSYFVLSQK